jgi:hypothetical protein
MMRLSAVFAALLFPMAAGINWKAVWMEPGPIFLDGAGATVRYRVFGLNGEDARAELTAHPRLIMRSLNREVVEIDRENATLAARSLGKAEIRVSFSSATSLIQVYVRKPE